MNDKHLDNLIKHAADAERFAQWVDAGEPAMREPRRAPLLWAGGIAAATAMAVTIFALQHRPAPAPSRMASSSASPAQPDKVAPPITVVPAFSPADLSRWTFLEPGAAEGLPSLTDDRSVLLAVYRGAPSDCECLVWRVADEPRISQASSEVLEQAMSSSCREGAEGVTVYAVRGPRHLLPFHEEDARMLADCLASNDEDCLSPEAALEHIAGREAGSDGASWSDLAASALAMCVPHGLSVTSTTLPLAH